MFQLLALVIAASASAEFARRFGATDSEIRNAKIDSVASRAIVAATTLSGVGIVLVGIPGWLFLEVVDLLYALAGDERLDAIGADAWPTAIFLSLLFPWTLPPASAWFMHNAPENRRPAAAYTFGLGVTLV